MCAPAEYTLAPPEFRTKSGVPHLHTTPLRRYRRLVSQCDAFLVLRIGSSSTSASILESVLEPFEASWRIWKADASFGALSRTVAFI